MSTRLCRITIRETAGFARESEPFRVGVPFPRHLIRDTGQLELAAPDGIRLPLQTIILETWPDRSVKWAVLSFLVYGIQPHSEAVLDLLISEQEDCTAPVAGPVIAIEEDNRRIVVDTGGGSFALSDSGKVFDQVSVAGTGLPGLDHGVTIRLEDVGGIGAEVHTFPPKIEERGPLFCSVVTDGTFFRKGKKVLAHFKLRYAFWVSRSTVEVDVTLHNPRAARHPRGLWDLGDRGSLFFRELALRTALSGGGLVIWQTEPAAKRCSGEYEQLILHQNSSGGANWESANHINHRGELTVSFKGYRVGGIKNDTTATLEKGARAVPWLLLANDEGWVAGGIRHFWQNFPKTLKVAGSCLHVSLFPQEQGQPFELQGGERKRHTVVLDFGLSGRQSMIHASLAPLVAVLEPEWVEKTGTVPYFTASDVEDDQICREYIDSIIDGSHSFFQKREVIDEYGWRNFGDQYADHEAVNHPGPAPLVSHYNNQYDFLQGAFTQFLRSGDGRWRELMEQQALHSMDIDMYHTDADKASFNHGLFWHTDHYKEARTSTHRSYSRKNLETLPAGASYGGGPSNEHNYASGLLHYYFITGDAEAAAAVHNLADWVFGLDDGSRTLFGLLDDGPTGLASRTAHPDFHKPGRGAGNSISVLLDAYRLTRAYRYIEKAEELLRRCIHPRDNVADLTLGEPECRWSYLVFLQVLGKYLDFKRELGEIDYNFHYGRESLLHYTEWMAENEVPYKEVLHKVEIPTETWPAHDIRKSHVFYIAAKYGEEGRRLLYRQKAEFFFHRCLTDLLSFETAFMTRPQVILAVYGQVYNYYRKHTATVDVPGHNYNFGSPTPFRSQRARLRQTFLRKMQNLKKQVCLLAAKIG